MRKELPPRARGTGPVRSLRVAFVKLEEHQGWVGSRRVGKTGQGRVRQFLET